MCTSCQEMDIKVEEEYKGFCQERASQGFKRPKRQFLLGNDTVGVNTVTVGIS